MFQHAIDPCYQERISVEGIYDVRNILATHPALEPITRGSKRKLGHTLGLYWILNGHHCSGVQCSSIFHDKDSNTFKALQLVLIKTFAKDDADIKLLKRIS